MSEKTLTVMPFALIVLVAFAHATATDIYISQVAQGADDGSACANSHSVAWFNTQANWGTGAGHVSAGGTVHLCGTITSALTVQASGTPGNPITVLFEPNAQMTAPYWGSAGAISSINKNYITVDGGTNGSITASDNGTLLTNQKPSTGVNIGSCNTCEIRNLTVNNMYVRVPLSADFNDNGPAILVTGSNILIHNNSVSNSRIGIDYSFSNSSFIRIYNNTIFRTSHGITFADGGNGATVNDVQIYNNDISDDSHTWDGVSSNGGHYHGDGIHFWTVHTGNSAMNVKIFGNYIHGDLGRNVTAWIYIEDHASDIDSQTYNNVLVVNGTSYPANGMIAGGNRVYNNTIVNSGSSGIACIDSGTYPTLEIRNNVLYNCGTALTVHLPNSSMVINNNLYNFKSGFSMGTVSSTNAYSFKYNMAAWQAIAGFDANSIVADPQFAGLGSANYHLSLTSPAIDTGANLSAYFTTDKDGVSRPQGLAYDMGAYEYPSGAPAPTTFSVNVSLSGPGSGTVAGSGINCGTMCSTIVGSGSSVSLVATPSNGSAFAGWGGACSGTGSCTLTINSDTNVTATFVIPTVIPASTIPASTYALNVAVAGFGSGTVTGSGVNCGTTCSVAVNSGASVTLTATPASDSNFAGWVRGCTGTGSCTLTINSDTNVTAMFRPTTYCPSVDPSIQGSLLNRYGCPRPLATKFDLTPDFNGLNLTSIRTMDIGISRFGKISYSDANIQLVRIVNGFYTQLSLDNAIDINDSTVKVDTSIAPSLNFPATITLYNITVTNPAITRDGQACTDCNIISYSNGTVVFSVPHFSTYQVVERASPPVAACGNGVCDAGETCSTCPADCGACPSQQAPSSNGSSGVGGVSGGGVSTVSENYTAYISNGDYGKFGAI